MSHYLNNMSQIQSMPFFIENGSKQKLEIAKNIYKHKMVNQ